jgi:hypothetical protein
LKRENRIQQINAGTKENINMRELNVNEIEQVNGGILPLIIASDIYIMKSNNCSEIGLT